MEDEFVAREKKILSILEQEIADGEEMADAVRSIAAELLLKEKGFTPSDIRRNVQFDVHLGSETLRSRVDFIVSVGGKQAMVMKCAAGSLSSRERHVVAAARVAGGQPPLLAVVMDPMSAVVLDVQTGKVIAEGFDAIPTKEQLLKMVSEKELKPYPAEKLDREKRILLAFDAIQCCIPQGADGGVSLADPDHTAK